MAELAEDDQDGGELDETEVGGRPLLPLLGPNSRGRATPWEPVRASQIRPSNIARSSRRGRPDVLRALVLARIGASSAQSTSSTRQMGGSSFSVAATGAAESGASTRQGYNAPLLSRSCLRPRSTSTKPD